MNLFTGGNFQNLTIFALGIMPYISASIILQLLAVIWPYLEKLQKEGEVGRRKITQYTRYGTIVLSIVQALGISIWVTKIGGTTEPIVLNPGFMFFLTTVRHAHHRHRVHHVAGRADHGPRDRQRDLADHLRGHRGRRPAVGAEDGDAS